MNERAIKPVVMPKWGLAMTEGLLAGWHVAEGAMVEPGDDLCDIETEKITNVFEAQESGRLVRRLAEPGDVVRVGALIGIIAEEGVAEADIEAFVADYNATHAEEAGEEAEGPGYEVLDVAGRSLAYARAGTGPDSLVFVHGFGGDRNAWLFNQPAFAERFDTVALDLPGHGASSKDVGDGGLHVMAGAITGLVEGLGLDRPHLVGHSYGGALAIEAAARAPERYASLILIAPCGLGEEISRDYIDGFLAAARRKDLEPVLAMLFADPGLVTRGMVNDVLGAKRDEGADEALTAMARAAFAEGRQRWSLRQQLADHPCQRTILWGEADRIVPARHTDGLPEDVTVELLPGVGHMPHMEAYERVNSLILESLEP